MGETALGLKLTLFSLALTRHSFTLAFYTSKLKLLGLRWAAEEDSSKAFTGEISDSDDYQASHARY